MLIIDGHNLAFADDDARRMLIAGKPGDARHRVLELVETFAKWTKQRATVVFDGTGGRYKPPQTGGRVRYRFSGAERSADTDIAQIISRSTGRRELCVVTNDRSLGAAARSLHARTMGCKEFLKETARIQRRKGENRAPEPRAKRFGAPPAEVEYWLKVFSDDDVDVAKEEDKPVRRKRKT